MKINQGQINQGRIDEIAGCRLDTSALSALPSLIDAAHCAIRFYQKRVNEARRFMQQHFCRNNSIYNMMGSLMPKTIETSSKSV